jgi:hypothetical protein
MTQEEFETLRRFARTMARMRPDVKALHGLYERSCERDLTPREDKRLRRLEERISLLAAEVGLKAYFIRYPRVWPVWLVPANWDNEFIEAHHHVGIPAGFTKPLFIQGLEHDPSLY